MSYLLGIDYDEMRAVAGEFDARAAEAEQLVMQAREAASAVLQDWQGFAADEYAAQAQACGVRMAHAPEMLRHIAGALRTTADVVQQAEEHARWELAQRMNRGGV
jgi:WXG100 family type VII secretion target